MPLSMILFVLVATVTFLVYRFVRRRSAIGVASGVAAAALGLQLLGLWVMAELTFAGMG